MKVNVKRAAVHTHEGAKASHINAAQQLRRSVMACLLWENSFYEDGITIVDRIKQLVPMVDPKDVVNIAREARGKMHLRHVPLLLVREMCRHATHKRYVSRTLQYVINRPDELTEFLAIYWKDGRQPLSAKVKQGLSYAFQKFSEYQLAKYDREGVVKLRDVLFLCHGKPKDEDAVAVYRKLVDRKLTTPDTWEVALSAGEDKKATFERLMLAAKLGALAFLRNLRNMTEAGVDKLLMSDYGKNVDVSKILPFQFIAGATTNPDLEPLIENMMLRNLKEQRKLKGKTILLVDVSGSMDDVLSDKSKMKRLDAACGLAILLREIAEDVGIYSFSNQLVKVPLRSGFALRDAILHSQQHGGTELGKAVRSIPDEYDRIIVITDEQSHDSVPAPKGRGYIVNVACNKNGVGYGDWNHIDGFSGAILEWMRKYENSDDN